MIYYHNHQQNKRALKLHKNKKKILIKFKLIKKIKKHENDLKIILTDKKNDENSTFLLLNKLQCLFFSLIEISRYVVTIFVLSTLI